jgi:hypothetical protein
VAAMLKSPVLVVRGDSALCTIAFSWSRLTAAAGRPGVLAQSTAPL